MRVVCSLPGRLKCQNTLAFKETDFKAIKNRISPEQIKGDTKFVGESHLAHKALRPQLHFKIMQINRNKAPISYLHVEPFTRNIIPKPSAILLCKMVYMAPESE